MSQDPESVRDYNKAAVLRSSYTVFLLLTALIATILSLIHSIMKMIGVPFCYSICCHYVTYSQMAVLNEAFSALVQMSASGMLPARLKFMIQDLASIRSAEFAIP